MPKLILPSDHLKRIIRRRRRLGIDRRDEVWNGVYVVSPEADNEHQELSTDLAGAIKQALAIPGRVRSIVGTNISDRSEDWRKNFRIPDVAVFLPGNTAQNRQSHWLGGPDFAVEIVSRGDSSRKKFAFYSKVGVRELMFVERFPWRLELHHNDGGAWRLVGASDPTVSAAMFSAVLGLAFRLIEGEDRPQIEIVRPGDDRCWLA